jgi:uncharacterized protein (DUF1015 family)
MMILPAHRLLKDVDPEAMAQLISRAAPYFEIMEMPLEGESGGRVPGAFTTAMAAGAEAHTIGMYMKGAPTTLYLLTLRPGVMAAQFGDALAPALRDLDVTVLTRLIFMTILGFDQARLDDETRIAYATAPQKAVDGVRSGEYDVSFILNPTRIEQVQAVARNGLIMPRKSTYFYPKVVTGQVFNPLA